MKPDLRTHYLGFELSGPLVASASPLTGTLEGLRRVQEAGASFAVMPSLFEEQIEHEELSLHALHEYGSESFPEAHWATTRSGPRPTSTPCAARARSSRSRSAPA